MHQQNIFFLLSFIILRTWKKKFAALFATINNKQKYEVCMCTLAINQKIPARHVSDCILLCWALNKRVALFIFSFYSFHYCCFFFVRLFPIYTWLTCGEHVCAKNVKRKKLNKTLNTQQSVRFHFDSRVH